MEALLIASDLRHQQRFDAQEKAVRDALAAAEKAVAAAMSAASLAVTKAEVAAEKRLDSVNEFRGQLKDQAATLLPRTESEQRFTTVEQRLSKIESMQTRVVGRDEGKSAQMALLFSMFTLLIAIAGIIVAAFHH
jgi:hypothetical protein